MQRSAFEVESSDSNFQVRGREGSCRARLKERNTQRGEERGESGGLLEGGVRGTVTGVGVVESCGRIRCPFPGKSRRSIETCIMAAIIHFLSDRGDLLYGGCSVHAFLSVAPLYRRICTRARHRLPASPQLARYSPPLFPSLPAHHGCPLPCRFLAFLVFHHPTIRSRANLPDER